jgi:hypothetical protein
MSSKSLWGEIPNSGKASAPSVMLKVQAEALRDLTKGQLIGEVVVQPGPSFVDAVLMVKVPALGGYQRAILTVRYPFEFYPLKIIDAVNDRDIPARTEEEYEQGIRDVLSSPKVLKIVGQLLANTAI